MDPRSSCVAEKAHDAIDDSFDTGRRRRKRKATRMHCMHRRPQRFDDRSSSGYGSLYSLCDCAHHGSKSCKYNDIQNACIHGSQSFPWDAWDISQSVFCMSRIDTQCTRGAGSQDLKNACFHTRNVDSTCQNGVFKASYQPKRFPGIHPQKLHISSQVMDSNQGAEDDSLHIAETISGIPSLHIRKASLKSDELPFDADGTPSQELTGNMDTRVQRLDAEDERTTKILTGEHYLAGKAAILRSIEGDVRNGSALTLKEVCPFTCPPSGKVCICGRRREMEDTAVTIPFFMKIPKCLAAEKPQNGAIFSDLHFYAVYDGHGGSQVIVLSELFLNPQATTNTLKYSR